jgi:hypothetical protein
MKAQVPSQNMGQDFNFIASMQKGFFGVHL